MDGFLVLVELAFQRQLEVVVGHAFLQYLTWGAGRLEFEFECQFSPVQSVDSSSLENLAGLGEILHCVENLIPLGLKVVSAVLAAGYMVELLLSNLYAVSDQGTAGFAKMAVMAAAGFAVAAGIAVTGLDNAGPIPNLH